MTEEKEEKKGKYTLPIISFIEDQYIDSLENPYEYYSIPKANGVIIGQWSVIKKLYEIGWTRDEVYSLLGYTFMDAYYLELKGINGKSI